MICFVQPVGGGPIKIGHSKVSVHERLAALQTGSPYLLELLLTIQGGIRHEKDLHRRFAHARSHGEWFHPCPELLAYIAGKKEEQSRPRRAPMTFERWKREVLPDVLKDLRDGKCLA